MTTMVWTYLAYLCISISLTVWVAHTLKTNGRVFLVDAFRGNDKLADSVNHLLVVGFYLVNVGFVSLALQFGGKATNIQDAIEYLSLKIGLVLVLLGGMHFFNLFVFTMMRRRAIRTPVLDVLPADNGPRANDYLNRLQEVHEKPWTTK